MNKALRIEQNHCGLWLMLQTARLPALIPILCVIALCSPMTAQGPESAITSDSTDDQALKAMELARSTALGYFLPSLEMKERADFLVVTALLAQQSITEEVVPIYPED